MFKEEADFENAAQACEDLSDKELSDLAAVLAGTKDDLPDHSSKAWTYLVIAIAPLSGKQCVNLLEVIRTIQLEREEDLIEASTVRGFVP